MKPYTGLFTSRLSRALPLSGQFLESPVVGNILYCFITRSAVDFFSVAFIVAPFAIVAGATISVLQVYRPQNFIAWG